MQISSRLRNSGFSLVEITVATLLLIIIVVAVFGALSSSKTITKRSNLRNDAYLVGGSVAEELRKHIRADHWDNTSNPINPSSPIYNQPGGWTVWYDAVSPNPFANLSEQFQGVDLFNYYDGKWKARIVNGSSSGGPAGWRVFEVEVQWNQTIDD